MLLNTLSGGSITLHPQIDYSKIKHAIASFGSKIEYLWVKTFYNPSFTSNELRNIEESRDLLNKQISNLTYDNASSFYNKILVNPKEYNKNFSRSLRLYLAKKKAFGKTNDAFEGGLISLKDLTFSLYQIDSYSNLDSMKKRVTKISNLSDDKLSSLKISEKLSSHEIYLTHLATKIENIYKNILKCSKKNDDLTEFLRDCANINNKIWINISVEEHTLLFFGEDKYLSAIKKKRPFFMKLRKKIRRGDQQHVSLLTNKDEKKRPTQVHITYKRYENSPLRVIDILSSEFITLDLKSLLTEKGKQILGEQTDDIDLYLKELWKKKLDELISNNDLLKICNSNTRKVLAATKWLGFKQKNKKLDGSNLMCSEFMIILIAALLKKIDKELINDHESCDSFLLNPLKEISACNYTPGDVLEMFEKYGNKSVVSDYLNKILI